MIEEQIKNGFWKWDIANNHPPASVTNFSDYTPSPKLRLNITQLMIGASEQKKIVNEWSNRLHELTDVRYLWLSSRVSQKIFDAVCEMNNLEGLWIKWSGIKNIEAIKKLNNLKHLRIGGSSQIISINALESMTNLETLELQQLNKISDFTMLRSLTQLRGLGIYGSMWAAQKIDSLKPLSTLKNLQFLDLTHSIIKDKSFDPLLKLPELISFYISWNYPIMEFEKLKSLPNLKYGNIETSYEEMKRRFQEKIRNAKRFGHREKGEHETEF